jgi:hypothetical protein
MLAVNIRIAARVIPAIAPGDDRSAESIGDNYGGKLATIGQTYGGSPGTPEQVSVMIHSLGKYVCLPRVRILIKGRTDYCPP